MKRQLHREFGRESGQAMVEYAFILALVALVCVGTLAQFGQPINNIFNAVSAGF